MKKYNLKQTSFIFLMLVLNLSLAGNLEPVLGAELLEKSGSVSLKDPLFLISVGNPPEIPVCGVGTWQQVSSPTTRALTSVFMTSPNDGWAVGVNGVILHYSGGSWQTVTTPATPGRVVSTLNGLYMNSPSDGWAVGYDSNNKVVIFHYDGTSWKDHTLLPLIAGQLNKVVMTSPTTGWAVGAGGLIMRYTGGQWSVFTSPTTNHIVSLAKVPNSEEEELWASVWTAPLLHYKGGSWQSVSNPVVNNSHFISMAFLSSTDGWAGAANQGFYHYDGVNWQYRTENNGAGAFSGINLLSPTNGWSFGGYYFAHFDGQKWRMTQQNVNVSRSSLSMASETEGWAVGGEGTIWRYNSELGLSRCLSGRVTTDKGQPVANVTIADGHGNTAVTGTDGYYYFNGLAADTYTLTPSFVGYLFYPLKRSVNLVTYAAGQDFAALIDMEDSDGDGLPNAWEVLGYDADGDGIIDVDLPALGANPLHKDLFVEADYMVQYVPGGTGVAIGKSLKPKKVAMDKVIAAFANAPVTNPDGRPGITLHVDVDEAIPYQAVLTPIGQPWSWAGFNQIKNGQGHFSPAKRRIYHYVVFAEELGGDDKPTTSEFSRIGGTDFVVSLGGWNGGTGTAQQQAGAFMHELGHNLGLRHGGADDENYKPNFLSVMNYSFQSSGLIINGKEGNLDYSRFSLPSLDENHLNETVGLNGGTAAAGYGTRYYCLDELGEDWTSKWVTAANGPIDWDCLGNAAGNVWVDVNKSGALSIYTGSEEWSVLDYKGGGNIGLPAQWLDQPLTDSPPLPEITYKEDQQIRRPYFISLSGGCDLVLSSGVSANRTLTLSNIGTQTATVTLTQTSSGWFNLSGLPSSPVNVAPGASVQYPVGVTAPSNRQGGISATATVIATVVENPLIQDAAELNARLGPMAWFESEPASADNPLSLVFTDRSVGAATAWLWDFGDGTTSTEQNPSHSYMTFGSYTVKLTVTGPDGSDTLIKQRELWTLKNILYLPLILR